MGSSDFLNSFFVQEGHLFRTAGLAIAAIWAINFVWTFYQTRKFYRNLPGPPHSWLFGHLPALIKASKRYPPDIHPQLILNSLVDEYNLRDDGVMYLDTFPVRCDNQMVITRGDVASQCTVHHVMRKHPLLRGIFGRVIGLRAISVLDGAQWKEYRSLFNAGFAASNISALIPAMLDEGEIFVSRLSTLAASGGEDERGGYTPSIMQLMKDLTADVIMRLTVGKSTHCQETPSQLIDMICAASRWPQPASINPFQNINFAVNVALRWYDWRCKKMIRKMVVERWEEMKAGEKKTPRKGEAKVMLDIALWKYYTKLVEEGGQPGELDEDFLDILCDNVKGFVFGGQDTTANSTSWILYILFKHPSIVAEVRREHNAVFGTDLSAMNDVLRASPHLINDLPWTTAVIKESMRIFAPASSIRIADEGTTLKDPLTGRIFPTKDQLIFMPTHIYSRDGASFPNPDDFLPNRFLPDNENSQKIDTDKYRPFEKGPRACIGQDLAMTEIKLILALVVRRFSFEDGYAELNRRRGTTPVEVEVEGGVAYPVLFTTAQPKDGMPMWVREEVQ